MDLTKTELYQTLTECRHSENADQVFHAHLSLHVEPHVVGALTNVSSQREMSAFFLKLIRACDYLGTSVPETYTTSLYDSLYRLSSEELSSLIDEFGENEIGLCIQRAKNVKPLPLRADATLSRLLSEHARHVELSVSDYQTFEEPKTFEEPEHVVIDNHGCEDYDEEFDITIPEAWSNLKTVKCAYDNIFVHLDVTYPKLETIEVKTLICRAEQPLVTTLKVDKFFRHDSVKFPNLKTLDAVQIVDS